MVHYTMFMNVNSLFCASHIGKEDLGNKSSERVFKKDQMGSTCSLKIAKGICGELVSLRYQS